MDSAQKGYITYLYELGYIFLNNIGYTWMIFKKTYHFNLLFTVSLMDKYKVVHTHTIT